MGASMSGTGGEIWWQVTAGAMPGLPIGSVVSFANEGPAARVMLAGVGQVGTIRAETTTQTASADGSVITLDNPTEGWHAVLSRRVSPQAPAGWGTPPAFAGASAGWVQPTAVATKSRMVAAALALILGGFGLHKFYLGKALMGILYFVLCWTGIPSIIAWIEGISYLITSDEDWARKYGGPVVRSNGVALGCLWIFALLPLLAIVAIIGLIFLGGQVSRILSTVGTSV